MRRIRIRKTWLALSAALLALGAIWIVLTFRSSSDLAQVVGGRRDHFRLVGEVEFDGERIAYDEIIEYRVVLGKISTMGLEKGDNRVGMSRLWIARTLASGSALLMEVPDAAGLFADFERIDEPAKPAWTPASIRDFMRPPPEFLPLFVSVDRADAPSVMEAYVSDAYYRQAHARLRIVDPIRIEFVPPTQEAHDTAWAQAHAEPHIDLYDPGELSDAWSGLRVLKIGREDWSRWPDVEPAISGAIESRASGVPMETENLLFRKAARELHWGSGHFRRYGVPQSKYADSGWGRLYQVEPSRRSDATIPVSCDWQAMICSLEPGRGYHILYKRKLDRPGTRIDIRGTLYDVRLGMAVIDHETSDVYLIGLTFR